MIKKILRPVKRTITKIVQEDISRLCYRNRFLSMLYYIIFDQSFIRECQAVLSGKVKHIEEAKRLKANYFLLVRNTHRLEKGLLMRPKRNVFGKDYIQETLDSFLGLYDEKLIADNRQMKWFKDVLTEYFQSASEDPDLKKLGECFYEKVGRKDLSITVEENEAKFIPYYRSPRGADISFDEFYKLTKQRRSVRWFLSDGVPRELIDKAILAANEAPSACNRQPFEFRVFDDSELVKAGINLPMGTKGYGHSVPVFAVLVGNLDAYFDERDRHVIYIDASLAAMSFMLALETMGLSSCAINWPDIESRERKMHKFLKLKSHQRPIMCMGVGYPDPEGLVAYSAKRPLSQIRTYN